MPARPCRRSRHPIEAQIRLRRLALDTRISKRTASSPHINRQ